VVFAVPELEEAFGRHWAAAAGGGAIQADSLGREVVHPQQMSIQGGFQAFPGVILAQSAQYISQPVIPEVQSPHSRTDAGPKGLQTLFRPGLYVAQPVVALRKDVGQPMGGKVLIQQRRQAHPFHMGQQQRGVIHPFRDDGQFFGHTMRVPHFSKLVKGSSFLSHNNDRTAMSKTSWE
jgi:hypothetical protein